MEFFLGTHEVSWLRRTDVPLFVSHRRLARQKGLPRALGRWCLDSGGFSEISLHGRWVTEPLEYADAVGRYQDEIGGLLWCAPMDWMCEPVMLQQTGLSIEEHQHRTVENVALLRQLGLPVIPVLQGWDTTDYHRCVEVYTDAGFDLESEPIVGIGTVCRRQDTAKAEEIVLSLQPLHCHGFGVKITGLSNYGWALASADSMAWSFNARKNPPLPGCKHKNCNSCLRWALAWRERLMNRLKNSYQQPTLTNWVA